jgi:hypothetical protein
MKIPEYDVFSGKFGDGDAIWLEAVDGLDAACERMKQRAARLPGKYFVFCQTTHIVQASVDTSVRDQVHPPKASSY